ncbi:copper amine oxidase N-terminal domain-containing protein [Paenibacillus profundus]|uniref:Copper amine oxidase N-terminal domain-containing protein n=1 Tax=Paenibacillus profundus TaxID=1173085 RepID=A0ABS8YKI3_9BACL|nr:copper amine oxidase N-terminal domain-containing protein [Paenibacillus profundus]MCE5170767.1 copper amine oxidase N-terminal domain-containing protein [Paenibacillus profundus]
MKQSKWITAVTLAALLLGGIPSAYAAPMYNPSDGITAGSEKSDTSKAKADIIAKDIQKVNKARGDSLYSPLYNNRSEDREALAAIAAFINTLQSKGTPYTLTEEESDSHRQSFQLRMSVEQKDKPDIRIMLYNTDTLVFGEDAYSYKVQDAKLAKFFMEQFQEAQEPKLPSSVSFGESITIKGASSGSESGTVDVFLMPAPPWESFTSANGIEYPANNAIWLYRSITEFGRYDFTFQMPAYGRTLDGKSVAIKPGNWDFAIHVTTYMMAQSVMIKPASDPVLALQGIPLANAKPQIRQGKTLLPLRLAAELTGHDIIWDQRHRRVGIDTDAKLLAASPASRDIEVWLAGKPVKTEIAPLLLQGTVYVPLETLTAHLGVKAEWMAENRVVNLSLPTVLLKPDKHTNDADVHDMLQLLNEYVKQYNAHNEQSIKPLFNNEIKWARSFAYRPLFQHT